MNIEVYVSFCFSCTQCPQCPLLARKRIARVTLQCLLMWYRTGNKKCWLHINC